MDQQNGTGSVMFAPGIAPGLTPGGSFTPVRLPGLVSWLRSDKLITLNGSTVSAWGDLSGNGSNAVQATAINQMSMGTGVKGLPCLRGAAGTYLHIDKTKFAALTAVEIFVIAKSDTSPPPMNGNILLSLSSSWFSYYGTDTVYDDLFVNTRLNAIWTLGSAATSCFCINTDIQSGTNLYHARLNGTQKYSTSATTFTPPPIDIRIGGEGGITLYNGDIYEVIMFNRVLSTGERALVNQYVYARYGIVGA
jgi:hypothetical protein